MQINNNSPFKLILDRIDVTTDRVGEITIIDSDTLKQVEYKVSSGKIEEIHSTGMLEEAMFESDFDKIVYTPVGPATLHNFGDTITYQPTPDLLYVWTEGQEKTTVTVTVYQKKSFNLFGDAFAD